MLRRLAAIAEVRANEPKRDKKPRQGHPNARAFARYLEDCFDMLYGRVPNHVIAACICLKYPEIDPPPTEDTIRDWRGVR